MVIFHSYVSLPEGSVSKGSKRERNTVWWYTYPSENISQVSWDDDIPKIWKNKSHVPNHQPVWVNRCPSGYFGIWRTYGCWFHCQISCLDREPTGPWSAKESMAQISLWRNSSASTHTQSLSLMVRNLTNPNSDMDFKFQMWVCLKIVYPYTQWLMIIIPTKWL